MAILSTGPIENSPVGGVRPTQQVTVKMTNNDSANSSTVLIQGYHLNGTRTLYVLEEVLLTPNEVVTRNYFANFDAFQFVFTTSGPAEESAEISVWGKNSGQLVTAHRLVSDELLGSQGSQGITSFAVDQDDFRLTQPNAAEDTLQITVTVQENQAVKVDGYGSAHTVSEIPPLGGALFEGTLTIRENGNTIDVITMEEAFGDRTPHQTIDWSANLSFSRIDILPPGVYSYTFRLRASSFTLDGTPTTVSLLPRGINAIVFNSD